MLTRILTENINYESTIELCKEFLPDGFTVIKAEGCWRGTTEHTLIIEVSAEHLTDALQNKIRQLSWRIKKENKQQAVLVQRIDCSSELL